MSTATAPAPTPTIAPFKMPVAKVGLIVCFYDLRYGENVQPQPAIVVEVGDHCLVLKSLAGGISWESVRHRDDPMLVNNEHWRMLGGWDYTEDYKLASAERAKLLERVDEVFSYSAPQELSGRFLLIDRKAEELDAEIKKLDVDSHNRMNALERRIVALEAIHNPTTKSKQ